MSACLLVLGCFEPECLYFALPIYFDAGFEVFIHIDARADLEQYIQRVGPGANRCTFITDRVSIYWGGFSMIRAELILIEAALTRRRFDKFVLVSDDTFPVLPSRALQSFFANDFDHISMRRLEPNDPFMVRYNNHYFFDHNASSLRGRPIEMSYIDDSFLKTMDAIGRFRLRGKEPVDVHYGSQWWALTARTVELILNIVTQNVRLFESFQYSAVPDEIYFQTIVGCFGINPNIRGGPVYVEWAKHPKPFIFSTPGEYESQLLAYHAFIRKTSSAHRDFLVGLQRRLLT